MARTRPMPFVVRSDPTARGAPARAVFRCDRCPETLELPIGARLNAEMMAKRAEKIGWRVRGGSRCPACSGAHESTERPEPQQQEMPPMAPPPRTDATPDEKQRIRVMLDKHFDDHTGCFLDGYSDQRIGQELDMPWAMVAKLREAAYGPIRVDPEVTALREEGAKLAALAASVSQQIVDLAARIEALAMRRSA